MSTSQTSLPPLVEPAPQLSRDEVARYSRHLIIPDLGVDGQKRLKNARVLVIGAGGLGAPVLLYLAAAGVGVLGVVDDDAVLRETLADQLAVDGEFWIEDLNSSNGTYINGKRITGRTKFSERDTLQVGPYVFGIRQSPTPTPQLTTS